MPENKAVDILSFDGEAFKDIAKDSALAILLDQFARAKGLHERFALILSITANSGVQIRFKRTRGGDQATGVSLGALPGEGLDSSDIVRQTNILAAMGAIRIHCKENNLEPYAQIKVTKEGVKFDGDELLLMLPMYAAAFFFAKHTELDFRGFDGEFLNDDALHADLLDVYNKMLAQFKEGRFTDDNSFIVAFLKANTPKAPEKIKYKRSTEITISTDKWANAVFSQHAEKPRGLTANEEGISQLKKKGIPVEYISNKATLFFDIIFDESIVQNLIDRGFTSFDFFVMTVLDNLKEQGNFSVTLSKIWHEMGGSGQPNAAQISAIVNSLRKGLSTIIIADDSEIRKAWGYETGLEVLSQVMPIQMAREKRIANGITVDAVVNILNLSPIYYVSKQTSHISTWDKRILSLYSGRRTARYWDIFYFLIRQIAWLRNGNSSRSSKILYSTLYEETGANKAADPSKARTQTLTMFYKILDEVFKEAGYVTRWKEDTNGKPGVILQVSKNGRRIDSKSGMLSGH